MNFQKLLTLFCFGITYSQATATHGDPTPDTFYDNYKSWTEPHLQKSFIFLGKTIVFGYAKYSYRVPLPMLQEFLGLRTWIVMHVTHDLIHGMCCMQEFLGIHTMYCM